MQKNTKAKKSVETKSASKAKTLTKETAPNKVSSVTIAVEPAAVETPKNVVIKSSEVKVPELQIDNVVSHDHIAACAYFLWQADGCRFGRDEYYWHQAELALKN